MSRDTILQRFATVGKDTDMDGHMLKLRDYASVSRSVIEFGVYDCTSTWALLAGAPAKMRSYDVVRRAEVDEVEAAARDSGTDFAFVLGDTVQVDIEPCDFLFIDSLHTYDHLLGELRRHADKVGKFIALHDTTTFGDVDQFGKTPSLWQAVLDYTLHISGNWKIKERYTHCHGFTVLERI